MARTVKGTFPKVTPATAEWEALTEALAEHRTPCTGSTSWTSEDAAARRAAVMVCRPCPLTELCGAAAESTRERFGVWGGVDRSPRVGAPPKTTTTRRTA